MNKFIVPLIVAVIIVLGYFVLFPAFTGGPQIVPIIELGPLTVRWYGVILSLSILAGYFLARNFAGQMGIGRQELDNFAFWLVLVSFLGARLYFVLFAFDYFLARPDEIIKIWHGGLSIYGALIAGCLFVFFWSRSKAYTGRQLFDLLAISLPLSQAIGRFGNFVNQEAFGLPTDLPWKMFVAEQNRPQAYAAAEYFHPTFLYEALFLVLTFFILRALLGRLRPGVLGFSYLVLYSLARFFIEPLRLDSVWIGQFRSDQFVALVVIMISGIFILSWQFARPKPSAGQTVEN